MKTEKTGIESGLTEEKYARIIKGKVMFHIKEIKVETTNTAEVNRNTQLKLSPLEWHTLRKFLVPSLDGNS